MILVTQVPAPNTNLSGPGTTQTVTLTADDGNGNTAQCSFILSLQDTSEPSITCPGDQIVTVDAACEIILLDYTNQVTVSNDCAATSTVTLSQLPVATTVLTGHNFTQTVVITADDGNGNTSNCAFSVMLNDEIDPMLTCPTDQILEVNATCELAVPDFTNMATATDNCATTSMISITQDIPVGTILTGHNHSLQSVMASQNMLNSLLVVAALNKQEHQRFLKVQPYLEILFTRKNFQP